MSHRAQTEETWSGDEEPAFVLKLQPVQPSKKKRKNKKQQQQSGDSEAPVERKRTLTLLDFVVGETRAKLLAACSGPETTVDGHPETKDEIKSRENSMRDETQTQEEPNNQRPPDVPVVPPKVEVCTVATTTGDLPDVHEDELLRMRELRGRLMDELELLRHNFKEELTALQEGHIRELQAREDEFHETLQEQKIKAGKDLEEREVTFQQELEAREASFHEEMNSKMENSWVYVVGGACALIGFLTAKFLEK